MCRWSNDMIVILQHLVIVQVQLIVEVFDGPRCRVIQKRTPWRRGAVGRIDDALPPHTPERRQVGIEQEPPGKRGNVALAAQGRIHVDVVLEVTLPQEGAVIDAPDDQLLGVDRFPDGIASSRAPDHDGQRLMHGQAVLFGGTRQRVVAHGRVQFMRETGGVFAEVEDGIVLVRRVIEKRERAVVIQETIAISLMIWAAQSRSLCQGDSSHPH